MKDFFDGQHPLSAWGRIKREMKMANYYYNHGNKEEALKIKKHVEEQIKKFKEVYGEVGGY